MQIYHFPKYSGREFATFREEVGDLTALTGTDAGSRRMADRMASVWASFAATGDPNNDRLPRWDPYDSQRRLTLVLDDETRVEADPRAQVRAWLKDVPATGVFG